MQQPTFHARRSQVSQLLAAMLGLLLATRCAMVVDPDTLEIRCELDSKGSSQDPCLEIGLHCIDGSCQECESSTETCNGMDDDCDGVVDEGQDDDGDGFTWCGGGIRSQADCVIGDASIHPPPLKADGTLGAGPTEACDGRDNDCDSKVDEDPKCAEMKRCVEVGCPENQNCDTTTGVCIEPREVGSGCTNDTDCRGGFCLKPDSFGIEVELMDNRCATACCSTADCDEGSVCVTAKGGTRTCLPANIVGDRSGQPGDRCTSDASCAAGVCDQRTCQERCFNVDACSSADAFCALWPAIASEPRSWLCTESMGAEPAGARCLMLVNACETGFCTTNNLCAQPCGRNADCETGDRCAYTEVRSLITSVVSSVPMCAASTVDNDGSEELCCTTKDCSEGTTCRPRMEEDQSWHMTCRGPS